MYKVNQIKEYIINEIASGRIKTGERLPGCREIAEKLSVNKITVNKAYQALEDEHLLYCVPRGGFYYINPIDEKGNTSNMIDFETVRPDPSLLPYRSFTHAMNQSIEQHKKLLFLYEEPLGFHELRVTLKERFEQNGVYADTSQILITNGAQQGIYLTLKSLFFNSLSAKLLVEIPTYHCLLDMAKSLHIECIGIKRRESGIDLQELEKLFKTEPIRAFYIIPKFHNPTGYSLSEKDKKKIVELCNKYQVLIIEDDYLSDLYSNKRTLPLYYYDTNQLTFYINSFSKTFMPGIRLGAMVIPETFLPDILEQKYILDISTSSIPQGALNNFIKSGMYDKHIKKVNTCYKKKMMKAQAILSSLKHPNINIYIPKQGLFLWITFPDDISVKSIVIDLKKKNILIPSSMHYYLADHKNSLRLCLSGVKEDNISSLTTIVAVIKEKIEQSQV